MRDRNVKWALFGGAALAVFIYIPTMGQRALAIPQQPTAELVAQPSSPLEILSIKATTATTIPSRTPRPTAQVMDAYEVVLRNKADLAIMAYAISHESQVEGKRARVCQSSLGFHEPMIAAGETKTVQSHLHRHGPTVTPVVDLVLLENGSYFGNDSCGVLNDYRKRLGERRATFQTVLQRLQRDGTEQTIVWMRQELTRDVRPLLSPKKIE